MIKFRKTIIKRSDSLAIFSMGTIGKFGETWPGPGRKVDSFKV